MLKHCQSAWCKELQATGGTVDINLRKAFEKQFPFNRGSTSDADSGICADNVSDGQLSPKMERKATRPISSGYRPRSKSCSKRNSSDEGRLVAGDRRSRQMKVRFDLPPTPSKVPQIPAISNSLAGRLGQFAGTNPLPKRPPPYEVACEKLRQIHVENPAGRGYYYTLDELEAAEDPTHLSATKSLEDLCLSKDRQLHLTQASASNRLSSYHHSQESVTGQFHSATPTMETVRCRYQDKVITAEPITRMASSVFSQMAKSNPSSIPTVMAETLPRKRVSNESVTRPFIDDMSLAVANRRIDVTVLSIDFKGVKVLLLKKTQPGPFGFYISTPDDRRIKGVYISNLSAVGLSPAVAVGDRILEVDYVSVKGKSLEEVQLLMSNRDQITLKLAPFLRS